VISPVATVSIDWGRRPVSIEYQCVGIDDGSLPLLTVQGTDDEYGTLGQVHGITDRVAQTEVVELVIPAQAGIFMRQ
jgi:fermentation-respiration switch protein FrsA (DUF1100 family)